MGIQLIDHLGRTYDVAGKRVTLGAAKTNGIAIAEFGAPGPVLELINDGMGWLVQRADPGSAIIVNGATVADALPVGHLDVIQAPGVSLRFIDTTQPRPRSQPANGSANDARPLPLPQPVANHYRRPVAVATPTPDARPAPVARPVIANAPANAQPPAPLAPPGNDQPAAITPPDEATVKPAAAGKDQTLAGVLAILLGGIGVHHFYLGRILLGVVYVLFSFTFIPMLVGIIEGIIYLTMSEEQWRAKYPAKFPAP